MKPHKIKIANLILRFCFTNLGLNSLSGARYAAASVSESAKLLYMVLNLNFMLFIISLQVRFTNPPCILHRL